MTDHSHSKSPWAADMAGAGFGTTFTPAQRSQLSYIQSQLAARSVSCAISYAYPVSDLAEATLTLNDPEGNPVTALKVAERWENFGDKARPTVHCLYNYDLYESTPDGGWKQISFAQGQETRGFSPKLREEMMSALQEAARAHDLFPKVREVKFGARPSRSPA